jgi:DNA-binding MarR family transcriptional regulator
MYNHELRATGLELTQFTLLMTLSITGEINQGRLGNILALDSTSLTRMLTPLTRRGWIRVKAGQDRRQKLLQLSSSGRVKFEESRKYWERAQKRLQQALSEPSWRQMGALLTEITSRIEQSEPAGKDRET